MRSARDPLAAPGLALGVLAVSTAAVLIKECTAPPLAIAAWRLVLASLGFLAACGARRLNPWRAFQTGPGGLALLSGTFLAVHFATWIASLSYTSVTSSVVLVTTSPLWVGLGSWAFLGEPPDRRLWQGVFLALAGSLLVATADAGPQPDAPAPLLGNALALAGSVAGSAYFLLGRQVQRQVDVLSYVTVVYGAAALCLVGIALALRAPLAGFSPRDWTILALIALVPQGLGHTLLNRSLRHFHAGVVAVALLGEPVAASALAWLALGEAVSMPQAAGAVLILLGVAHASWRGRQDPGPGGGEEEAR